MRAEDPHAKLSQLLQRQVACPNRGTARLSQCMECPVFRGWSLSSTGQAEGLRCVEGVLVDAEEPLPDQ